MKTRTRLLSLTLALAAVFFAQASLAWDASSEVRRLNKEAPSLDGFKNAEALVWLRDNSYRMLSDGTMEHVSHTIVMVGEHVPQEWKEIKLPVRENGKVTIEEAAWYNPMTGLREGRLETGEETLAGGAVVRVIKTPDDAVGRAVVLSIVETYDKRYGIDEAISMAGPLPVWEQTVTAEVPAGRQLFWTGRDVKEPVVTNDSGTQKYKWTVMNQEPWLGEGFIEYKMPGLAFSTRKGVDKGLSEMEELAFGVPSLPLPAAARGDAKRAGLKLMEYLTEPKTTLEGYPNGWVRPAAQIPEEGPWTPWEKTLLLSKWLKKLGWSSDVWWQSIIELGDDTPASVSLWEAPVLELSVSGGKSAFYQAGQSPEFGVTAPSVSGANIYRLKDGKYETRVVKSGSPTDHRLSLLWILNLDDNGAATGTLTVNVTGGWTDLISGGQLPAVNGLSALIRKRINFALPGMVLTPKPPVATSTGFKLDFDVRCVPGIVHSGNLLLRLPGGIPSNVGEMIGRNSDYTFRFPFMIDQKVRMNMPKGYRMIQTPPVKKIGEGSKAVLKESIIHWPKKAQLVADSTWVVKTTRVDNDYAAVLKEELNACLRWPVLDIPFRTK